MTNNSINKSLADAVFISFGRTAFILGKISQTNGHSVAHVPTLTETNTTKPTKDPTIGAIILLLGTSENKVLAISAPIPVPMTKLIAEITTILHTISFQS